MGFPTNRIVIDGRDIATYYGLIMSDEFTLSPPERKTYMVEVPGGNGFIDLAEAVNGDAVFSKREMEFLFGVVDSKLGRFTVSQREFETVKTRVSNWLHGMRRKFTLSFDPGYTYTGRFDVSEYYSESARMHYIKVVVTADPYKFKERMQYRVSSLTGRTYLFQSGRKPVRPIIKVNKNTQVTWNGTTFQVKPGTWRLSNVLFTEGVNRLSFGTWSEFAMTWGRARPYKWSEWRQRTWTTVKKWVKTAKDLDSFVEESGSMSGTIADQIIGGIDSINSLDSISSAFGSAFSGVGPGGFYYEKPTVVMTWGDMSTKRWSSYQKKKRWKDDVNNAMNDTESLVQVSYDWSDL